MDLNNLNKGRLNNLQDQETDFDQNAMWANIENRKERRPVFWWWGAGTGAVLLLVGIFFYFNFENGNVEKLSQIADNQSDVMVDGLSQNEKEIANQVLSLETNFENETVSTKEKSTKREKKSSKLLEGEQLSRTSSAAEKHITEAPISNSNYQVFETKSKKLTQISTEKIVSEISDPTVSQSVFLKLENKKSTIEVLPILASKVQFLEVEVEEDEKFDLKTIQNPKVEKFKSTNLLVTGFGGIGYQQRRFAAKDDQINSEYLASRKSNETILESWSLGFLVDKKINKKLQIGAGFELVQHNEKLTLKEYETNNIESFSKAEVPSSFLNQTGFLTKTTENIYQNQIRLLNVPLSFSYLLNTKNIRLAPTASVVFNISQTSMGHIQNEFGEATDMAPFFKSNIGLAYRLGCKVYYPLNSRYLVFANPQFEINPSDVSQSMNPISQKRNLLRLDLGISTQIGF